MKYAIILVTLFTFLNFSCNEFDNKRSSFKTVIKSKEKKNGNDTKNLEIDSGSPCKITLQNKDVVLTCDKERLVFKRVIINEMSISTDFTQESDNSFSLLYDLSASNTKIKERYLFTYSQEGIKLAYKEVIKFAREGISFNKIYFNNFVMNGKTYDDIQSLGSDIEDNYDNKFPIGNLFDSKKRKFAEEIYHSTLEDMFIDFPKITTPSLEIVNIEVANNQAYALQQIGEVDFSRSLLEEIIKKAPERVVAWLNLADTYWQMDEKNKAKKAYQKYIELMKSQNKDLSKIPQRVYDRSK